MIWWWHPGCGTVIVTRVITLISIETTPPWRGVRSPAQPRLACNCQLLIKHSHEFNWSHWSKLLAPPPQINGHESPFNTHYFMKLWWNKLGFLFRHTKCEYLWPAACLEKLTENPGRRWKNKHSEWKQKMFAANFCDCYGDEALRNNEKFSAMLFQWLSFMGATAATVKGQTFNLKDRLTILVLFSYSGPNWFKSSQCQQSKYSGVVSVQSCKQWMCPLNGRWLQTTTHLAPKLDLSWIWTQLHATLALHRSSDVPRRPQLVITSSNSKYGIV